MNTPNTHSEKKRSIAHIEVGKSYGDSDEDLVEKTREFLEPIFGVGSHFSDVHNIKELDKNGIAVVSGIVVSD